MAWNVEVEVIQTYRETVDYPGIDSEDKAIDYVFDWLKDGNLTPVTEDNYVEAWEIND